MDITYTEVKPKLIFSKYFFVSLLSICLLIFFIKDNVTVNPASRFATIDSLATQGSFTIEKSVFFDKTIDKVKVGEHFYSSKPPLFSVLIAIPYKVISFFSNISFAENFSQSVYLLNLLVGVFTQIGLLFFFKRLQKFNLLSDASFFLVFIFVSFGYLGISYSTSISNHSFTAFLLTALFYYFLSIKEAPQEKKYWIMTGLISGLLPVIDQFPSSIFAVFIAFFLIKQNKTYLFKYFVPFFVFPILTHLVIYKMTVGVFLPVQFSKTFYLYPGSYWLHPAENDSLHENKLLYTFHFFFGHNGFFAMTPVLLLGYYQLFLERKAHYENWLLFLSFSFLFIVYIFISTNYGGSCVGIRWLVPIMPLLGLYAGRWVDLKPNYFRIGIFLAFFLIGFLNVVDGLHNPWKISFWATLFR